MGDYRKTEKFARQATTVLNPRSPIGRPRQVIDMNTLDILDMPERRKLFNGESLRVFPQLS